MSKPQTPNTGLHSFMGDVQKLRCAIYISQDKARFFFGAICSERGKGWLIS